MSLYPKRDESRRPYLFWGHTFPCPVYKSAAYGMYRGDLISCLLLWYHDSLAIDPNDGSEQFSYAGTMYLFEKNVAGY